MPHVRIAIRTLTMIDDMVKADQGSKFRGWLGKVIPHIGDAYREGEEGHRTHMGASLLGQECPRAIWYNFHWATKSNFPGRVLRLFNRGHLEEARFIALLLMIGCQVFQQDANGKQYRISFAEGHAGGSGDGVALNIPDLPQGSYALCEFKTHGNTSFVELAGKLPEWRKHLEDPERNPFTGKGVREAKFEHFVQMQLYMRKMGLATALYVAVNKDTDDLYAEIITLDTGVADQFLERGDKLVWATQPPARISNSPGFYKCRFCDHLGPCQLKKAPDTNCRTCVHSRPVAGGEGLWHCAKFDNMIPKETQLTGCKEHELQDHYGK
jgi:hypothetical protein